MMREVRTQSILNNYRNMYTVLCADLEVGGSIYLSPPWKINTFYKIHIVKNVKIGPTHTPGTIYKVYLGYPPLPLRNFFFDCVYTYQSDMSQCETSLGAKHPAF